MSASCGQKSGSRSGSSSVNNALTNTYSKVATQSAKIGGLAPSSSLTANSLRRNESAMFGSAFGANWDDAGTFSLPDETTDANDSISLKEWMGHQISEDSVTEEGSSVSVFGRMSSTLGVFCAVGVALGEDNVDADGYPEDGSSSVTLTSSHVSKIQDQCNFDASDANGATITFEVSTPANTTSYDKKVILNPPNGGVQTVYFRSNSTEINIAAVEEYTRESVAYISRVVVDYDITNKMLRSEYIAGHDVTSLGNGNRIEVSRILYDETADEGYVMYMMHEEDSTDAFRKYV